MTSESQRTLLSLRLKSQASSLTTLRSAYSAVGYEGGSSLRSTSKPSSAAGLSLVELLIAIGILGVTMMLIGAAFPAGMAMSIAVSDETTSQAVFQKAVAEIKDHVQSGSFNTNLAVLPDGTPDRDLDAGSSFSWSAMVRRMADAGPMGNLCQVVVVVSRRPSGDASFMPNLQSVTCTASDPDARTLTIGTGFDLVPNGGYIIDGATGIAYIIVSRDQGNNKVVTLSTPPSGAAGDFWVVPGPYDGTSYSRRSPAIRVFQAMLYLP